MSKTRWLLALAVLCLLVAAAAVAYAAGKAKPTVPVAEVVRAKRFELVDGRGWTRGLLAITESGSPGLWLTDAKGKAGARLALSANGVSELALLDVKGKVRAYLALDTDGNGRIFLSDAEGTTSAVLSGGSASLDLREPDGSWANLAAGSLVVRDKDGRFEALAPHDPLPMESNAPAVRRRGLGLAPTGQLYVGVGSGHWIGEVMDSGRLVKLEDDSLWEVAPLDRIDTALWLPTTEITVLDGGDPLYPYKLVNTDDGEVANAKLVSQ